MSSANYGRSLISCLRSEKKDGPTEFAGICEQSDRNITRDRDKLRLISRVICHPTVKDVKRRLMCFSRRKNRLGVEGLGERKIDVKGVLVSSSWH